MAYLADIGDNLFCFLYLAAPADAADIDRIMAQGDAQEFLALGNMALFIVADRLYHHHNIILAQAFGAAAAMQSMCHSYPPCNTSCSLGTG